MEDVGELLDHPPRAAGPSPAVLIALAFFLGVVLARLLARRARADARD